MDRGASQTRVRGIEESDMTEQLTLRHGEERRNYFMEQHCSTSVDCMQAK